MAHRPALILASSSPRRLELLRRVGIEPDAIIAPEVDENPAARELPRLHALRVAGSKLDAVVGRCGRDAFVLAADTVVACGRRILPKAESEDVARACLELLSGRRHRVYGAIAIAAPDGRRATRLVETAVQVKRLAATEIDAYLASAEWRGKAGGYAIQGRAEGFIPAIFGSWSNIVGLPLAETLKLLGGLGWRPRS